jgi:glycosyltransferase involved in cell wall biosynthesis
MAEATMAHRTDAAVYATVSIGMPVYNGEKYICEALDSLLNQSHADFELIISDNASTDATEEICRKYAAKDLRIRYIRQSENRGILANFQFVLDEARGEYFMWAAADDAWDVNWIDELLGVIRRTGSRSAFGKIQTISHDSKAIKHYANDLIFDYRGSPLARRLKYFIAFEGAGKANPMYGIWSSNVLRTIILNEYTLDYFIMFDLLKKTEVAGCKNTKIYKRIHLKNEGGGVIQAKGKRLDVKTFYRLLNILSKPFPDRLISGYFQYVDSKSKLLFMAMVPVKYIFAYWFFLISRLMLLR